MPRTAGGLGDERASLERLVDPLDRVVDHGEEEARGELGHGRAGVEQRRRGVREPCRDQTRFELGVWESG